MHCPRAFVLLAMAAFATGCAPGAEQAAAPAARDADRPPPLPGKAPSTPVATDIAAMPAVTTSAAVAGQWFLQKTDPPRALWGVPASEGVLAFSCSPVNGQLVLERQAVGLPEDLRRISIDADGTRVDYPAERVATALAPMLVTRIALDAPILDRMLIARRLVVTAGSDAIIADAPGPPLKAVVDACRVDEL